MMPIRRDLSFNLPADRLTDWHERGPYVSHFLNTLSLFFPEGERFFIHSVRHYRDQATDPVLKKAVTGFIGQEAMHGREHEEYNQLLEEAGYPIKDMEARVTKLLEKIKANAPKPVQLAATIALEHFTAMLADKVLRDPSLQGNSDVRFARLWKWHALEETEHKAVAYDVWDRAMGDSPAAYITRVSALVTATLVFMRHVVEFYGIMLNHDPALPRSHFQRLRGYGTLANFLFGKPGLLRACVPDWLSYFRPGFHPWDDDNSEFLKDIDGLVAELADYNAQFATAEAA